MTQARDIADAPSTGGLAPAGTIIAFGGTTAPAGYLSCDGSAVLRADYADLFAAIGTTWGAPSATYFNVPDLRGAFLRGTGSHGTSNMENGNDYAGPSVGSFENDQLQDHTHTLQFYNLGSSLDNLRAAAPDSSSGLQTKSSMVTGTGGRSGDETRPFNAGILYCIKT